MVRMGCSYSINIQSMVEVLRKNLPKRKDVYRHMVYNVRLRTRRRKLELEADNAEVLAYHFDISSIKDYKSNSDNYSKSELFHLVSFMLVVFDNLINFFVSLLIIVSHCIPSCCAYINVVYNGIDVILYQRFKMLI